MGRLSLYSQRINCRISKRAGQILNEALDRTAASWKKAGGKDAYAFDYEDSTGDLGCRVKTSSAKGGVGINS
jgi:hypothetical protein